MYKLIYISCLCCLWQLAIGQDLKEELDKLHQASENYQSITYKVSYTSYIGNHENPIDVNVGQVGVKGKVNFNKIAHIEVITTPNYKLTVNHQDKKMAYIRKIQINGGSGADDMGFSVERLLQLSERQVLLPGTKKQKGMKLFFKNAELESVLVYYNAKSYLPEELEIQYRQEVTYNQNQTKFKGKPRMVVKMEDYHFNEPLPNSWLSCEAYLKKSGERWVLKEAYADYQLTGDTRLKSY